MSKSVLLGNAGKIDGIMLCCIFFATISSLWIFSFSLVVFSRLSIYIFKFSTILLNDFERSPSSSFESTSTRCEKSPFPMECAWSLSFFIGFNISFESRMPKTYTTTEQIIKSGKNVKNVFINWPFIDWFVSSVLFSINAIVSCEGFKTSLALDAAPKHHLTVLSGE